MLHDSLSFGSCSSVVFIYEYRVWPHVRRIRVTCVDSMTAEYGDNERIIMEMIVLTDKQV